jgi:SNF2 family DNA or RNA helicase
MLYGRNAFKLTHADLPDAFAANHVITEPLAFGSLKDIAAFYEEHGVTPEIIENAIEGISPEPHILVEILRARQLAEAAKVPDIVTMVQDACAEGYSVVVFVNFTDTVRAMHEHFPEASIIIGGQSGDNREENVQRFQRNETNVIICNSAAGGVGVSLHDTTGDHPRMSLISPTYDVKVYVQMLGRIHRNGAKSPATQRVLVAAGTIEEKIVTALERKRLSMDTLHAQPTSANS